MPNQLLIKKIKVPVYKTNVWLIICDNIKNAIEAVEDQLDERIATPATKRSALAYTYGYEDHKGTKKILIFLKHNASPGVIAHEIKHSINIIFSWHGVRLSLVNDEPECYYLSDFVDTTHRVIESYKKKYVYKPIHSPKETVILTHNL